MNIMKRIRRLLAALVLVLAAGTAMSGDRVSEVCVVAGDIDYCSPKDV